MTHTKTLATLGILSILATGSVNVIAVHSEAAVAYKATSVAVAPKHLQNDSAMRVARRLQHRIEDRFQKSPNLSAVRNAVLTRRTMFARMVTVDFQDNQNGRTIASWQVTLGRYPDWMSFDLQGGARFFLNTSVIEQSLAVTAPDGLTIPSFANVIETKDDGKVVRATIEGTVQDGQLYDVTTVAEAVIDAFTDGDDVAVVPVQSIRGAVLYDDGSTTYVLTELGVGRSEFASSPWGRKQNIRKAMNEKANGIIIPQASTFSFNATLGGAITYRNGWYDSLIIVNGKDLEPAAGGGICQAATTVFRAAVAAGLPIVNRKSHSLYVTYYKRYGMGLDATIFPGRQDMTFQNDTPGPMILVGMTDGEDNAYSTIYGVSDDRQVTLDGPYFGTTFQDPLVGRQLRSNEVAWVQRVHGTDGSIREQLLVAQYSKLPKSVAFEFTPGLHGAADLIAEAQ